MAFATNTLDGTRVYFEDDGGEGAAVVLHGGFLDPIAEVRESRIAQMLPADEFRLIYVDHRGLGRNDKPHDPEAYAMPVRVADPVSVLDELSIERAHFIGTSWGRKALFRHRRSGRCWWDAARGPPAALGRIRRAPSQ